MDTDAPVDVPETIRIKVRARFLAALQDAALAAELEKCLWNHTLRACQRDGIPLYWVVLKARNNKTSRSMSMVRYRYTTRALSLEFNLKHPGNPQLACGVKERAIPVKRLVGMRPAEMWPERWKDVEERVKFRQLRREAATLDPATAPDGAYTCSKCKSRKTVYSEMQIRSADEPMTKFVRCLNCGKAWKD